MSLGVTANKERNGALLAYIASCVPGLHLRKLLKIVYLIDEKFMELRGYPLTWFDYYAWQKGPVAPEVYAVKTGEFSQYVTCRKDAKGSNIVDAVAPNRYLQSKQMGAYSPYELGVIDEVIGQYGGMSADELSELTHADGSLWQRVVEKEAVRFVDGKSVVEIPLQLLNEGDEIKTERYEEAKWSMGFQAALNQHKEADVSAS